MTSLARDVNEETKTIVVSAGLANPSYPLFYTVGDETIQVNDGADTEVWQVDRGVAGTEADDHGKGNALISTTDPFAAGGEPQRIRLLGPFTITHATANLFAAGATLAAIDEGTIVFSAWAFVDIGFNAVSFLTIFLGSVPITGIYDIGAESLGGEPTTDTFNVPQGRAVGVAGVGGENLIAGGSTDVPPTAGSARAYALIAEPA